jgi:hypothetical protein
MPWARMLTRLLPENWATFDPPSENDHAAGAASTHDLLRLVLVIVLMVGGVVGVVWGLNALSQAMEDDTPGVTSGMARS